MRNILLVEDDKEIMTLNNNLLKRHGGYNVYLAMNLEEARSIVAQTPLDIILLDITLPDGSGLDFLAELRQDKKIPVLILSALGKIEDRLKGLETGGNAYMPKPYDNRELLLTIEKLLELKEEVPDTVTRGVLTLNVNFNAAFVNGRDIGLSQNKEFSLLNIFVKHENKTLSPDFLYQEVWGHAMAGNSNALRVALSEVRRKLAGSGFVITSERGKGYRFEAE